MKKKIFNLAIMLLIFLFILSPLSASDGNNKLKKTTYLTHRTKFNINNISTWIYNNGDADIRPDGNSGFEYPKGSRKAAIFESGFVWGGKVNGKILVGGSTFTSGLQPGKILGSGLAEDPNSETVRVFRVRPDYQTADLSAEVNDGEGTEDNIRAQYEKDWQEWPAHRGAPYKDINKNNFYEPSIDIPGVPGADQSLWYVANDLDSIVAKSLYGSPTMGVELQVTVWGYKDIQVLNNMVFKNYLLINKSKNDFKETYLSIWSDPDLGDAGDDFVGCDTTLSFGYAYNGDDDDGTYGANTPAVGFKLLQGSIVPGNPSDNAKFMGKYVAGMKNLSMTSFPYHGKNSPEYNDPNLGDYFKGTLHFYNMMQGIGSSLGNPIINPITGEASNFAFSGDPVTNTGWINSLTSPPGDKRLAINSGPFTMAAGDTQEVVIAQIIAGGDEDIDRIEAVRLLKAYNSLAQEIYDFNFELEDSLTSSLSNISVTELDREIIFSWYDDPNLDFIENNKFLNYNFQGYTIYQYPNEKFSISEKVAIANFDLNDNIRNIDPDFRFNQPEKKGRNTGLQRHISVKTDYFDNDRPLHNGTEYYFGISTYHVNSDPLFSPRIIESGTIKLNVIPQSPLPGNYYEGKYGDKLELIPISGNSNIPISINIIDPTKLTGKTYKIRFNINTEIPDTNYERIEITIFDYDNNTIYERNKITLKDKFGRAKPLVFDGFEIEPFEIIIREWSPLRISDGDQFEFKTPKSIIGDINLAKQEVVRINVFPNPYYGKQGNENNQYEKFVTFNHLPEKATIRIFNLGGQLVNKIEKNDNSQFIKWDLTNGSNFWVPSGIYIIYIEMPELGKTKILKLAVVMENIVPDYF
ncbi:MAG: T9SS type A sorting domain-containing protein [Melioribacteraceae bacterium]|nr:T9SS type A sorting domain-containing protein [Melioribacteraceae bacterium]